VSKKVLKRMSPAALGSFLAVSSMGALAEVDAGVTTALTDAATDAKTVATAALLIIVGIVAIRYIRRAL
jgi:hypothetical protein